MDPLAAPVAKLDRTEQEPMTTLTRIAPMTRTKPLVLIAFSCATLGAPAVATADDHDDTYTGSSVLDVILTSTGDLVDLAAHVDG